MTKEDKELLLRDLCSRLPYRVKVITRYQAIDEPIQLKYIDCCQGTYAVGGESAIISGIPFDNYLCKPYLFPMSNMTEEQTNEYLETCFGQNPHFPSLASYDWLNKNHFDYRGLIPKGLAIDATGLNIY